MKFTVHIVPKAQMRARHTTTKNGLNLTYKAEQQVLAEEHLAALLYRHRPPKPLEGPLMLGVKAYLPIPQSWPIKKLLAAKDGLIRPGCKPDLDNLVKNIKDCLTAMNFWRDDRQVVEYLPGTGKYYDNGFGPRWEIEIVEPAALRAGGRKRSGPSRARRPGR